MATFIITLNKNKSKKKSWLSRKIHCKLPTIKKVFAIEMGGLVSHCGILAVLAVRIWRQLTRQSPHP